MVWEFGIDPDIIFNNSSENDEEHIQTQSEFDHKIDEILELLKVFPELVDDVNYGTGSFRKVRDELLEIILWACSYNADGMLFIAKTYVFWGWSIAIVKRHRFMKYCLSIPLPRIWSIPYVLEWRYFTVLLWISVLALIYFLKFYVRV